MKYKIITHPYAVLISFLFILISGEHIGGFYIVYLLLGLAHVAVHSILGIAGIAMLLFNIILNNSNGFTKPFLNLTGVFLMIASLIIFFNNDSSHYNTATFYQLVPQLFIALFIILSIAFIIKNICLLFKTSEKNTGNGFVV